MVSRCLRVSSYTSLLGIDPEHEGGFSITVFSPLPATSDPILLSSRLTVAWRADSNFDSADFSNAIVDRANFKGSSLRGTLFVNTVLTGTSFEGADVEGADFTEAAIGTFDLQNLCKNPTLKGENPVTGADTRLSAGCK